MGEDDFKAYANLCFHTFGDRVKYWTTINEPQIYGYKVERKNSTNANPATDTFLATHNMILCHAHVAQLYKQQYQATQNGKIGIPIVTKWFKPLTESREDVEAAGRAFDFLVGWLASLIRSGLPTFSDEEQALVQNSFDFIGCNYYTSRYACSIPFNPNETPTKPDQFQSVNLTVVFL
ncbi:hypothetical protein Cgig2_013274 [Carnegiea gigantea]|uniref:Beta-glucosidase n=1 Tax=Carnegiea gigantea TaxID=171969 RepID=A0A9Q1QBE3_9CARY|nr:hypothetical protein Cgig2_013274 [Carnegiea gigantea]